MGAGHPDAPGYTAPNVPSTADIVPQTQAGGVNDLCFGFTLSPNVEPAIIRTTANPGSGARVQDPAPVPLVEGTKVWTDRLDHDDLKNARITLPAGFAGSPDWDVVCTDDQFGLGNLKPVDCPTSTLAGTVFARVTAVLKAFPSSTQPRVHLVKGGGAAPTDNSIEDGGYVYNLEHGPNEVARLGIVVQPVPGLAPVKFTVRMVLSTSGRIQAVVENAPRFAYETENNVGPDFQPVPDATTSPIYLESVAIRAFGSKAGRDMPQDFVEFGTDCSAPLKAKVDVETYLGAESSMENTNNVQLTGCESLPFLPSLEVKNVDRRAGVPTGAEINVNLGQTTSGPKSALLKDAVVTLPQGLEIGAQVASGDSGLPLCSAASFAKDALAPAACPAGSKVGDVSITTPLLKRTLVGSAFLGEQSAVGELPPLYLEAKIDGATADDAPRIKLIGEVKVDENGVLTTTFKDAPQLRFSQLRLTFPGGPNALFSTPRSCGTVKGKGSFTSWATSTPVNVETNDVVIDQECDQPFNPSFSMEPSNNRVGASASTKVSIERPDRAPWLKDVKVSLPSGFLADLKVASECSKGDAANGTCPDSSRIGTVTTAAGVGEKPLSLKGSMYLVEREEGSVAGAAIVVRAKIGELDLGNVVVPAQIKLRPNDAGLELTTTAPLRFKGLALNLRSIVVDLDRENFPLNPTACGPLTAKADLVGDGGQTASPSTQVTYSGCGDLPFQPAFSAKLSGDTKVNGYPQVEVTMVPRAGDSNLKGARVVLPAGLATDPKNVQLACARDQFDAGSCPDNTKVGTVNAAVSITNDAITGNVYLVRVAGSALPGLGMSFTGRYSQRVLSTVKIDGATARIIADFATIPDLPLRRLDMTIAGGPKAPIKVSPTVDKCTADTDWDATFTGQGGKTHKVSIPVKCNGAGAAPSQKLTWSAKSGLKFTLKAPAGKTLKSSKLTLPSGFKLTKSKKSQKKYVKVKLSGGKGKSKISRTSISTTGTGAGPTTVTITVKPKGYTLPKSYKKKLKKGKKVKLKTRTVTNDGKVTATTLTVKTK